MRVNPRTLEMKIGQARRRWTLDSLCSQLSLAMAFALAVSVAWFLAEPWLFEVSRKWAVLTAAAWIGLVAAVTNVIRFRPTRQQAALELDRRFELAERVTTAWGLTGELRATEAGMALLNDAESRVNAIRVAEQFPVKPRKTMFLIPLLGALLTVTAVYYEPDTSGTSEEKPLDLAGKKAAEARATAKAEAEKRLPGETKPIAEIRNREGKSPELKELEAEYVKLMEKWEKEPPASEAKAREKVSEITAMLDKVKKYEERKLEQAEQLKAELAKLESGKPEAKDDTPLAKFNDALARNDRAAAQKEVDELRKKAKEKKLEPKELETLQRNVKEMKDKAERLQRNKEEQEKLKNEIEQAKKDARPESAEKLQRELDKLKEQTAKSEQAAEAMEKLAKNLEEMQKAAEEGDQQKLEAELEKLAEHMKQMEGNVQDAKDADRVRQELERELQQAAEQTREGQQGKATAKDGEGERGDGLGKAEGGEGKRPENKSAKTDSFQERLSGIEDPKGAKSFAGSEKGKAFKKATTVEMNAEIRKAAQEGSKGLDPQAVPRDARDAVKEYMEKLGEGK